MVIGFRGDSETISLTQNEFIYMISNDEDFMRQAMRQAALAGNNTLGTIGLSSDDGKSYEISIGNNAANEISLTNIFNVVPKIKQIKFLKEGTVVFDFDNMPKQSDLNVDLDELKTVADTYPPLERLAFSMNAFNNTSATVRSKEWNMLHDKLELQKTIFSKDPIDDVLLEVQYDTDKAVGLLKIYQNGKARSIQDEYSQMVYDLLKKRPETEQDILLKTALLTEKSVNPDKFTQEYQNLLNEINAREQVRNQVKTTIYSDGKDTLIKRVPSNIGSGMLKISNGDKVEYNNNAGPETQYDFVHDGRVRHLSAEETKDLPKILAQIKPETLSASEILIEIKVPTSVLSKIGKTINLAENGRTGM